MTLLHDALERTLLDPACARRWHTLMATWLDTPDAGLRQAILKTLEGLTNFEARADSLRLTFLAGATGESRFEHAAAPRLLAAEPSDPDRLAAFMAYQWLTALQHLAQRSDFVAALNSGRVPEMARQLAQAAARQLPPRMSPRVPEQIQRVAVIVPYVANRLHTPSVMAIAQCAVLAAAGRQVHIFSAQELVPPDVALVRGDGRELKLPPLNPQALANLLPQSVALTIADSRFSLAGRWRKLLPLVADFDPDVVLLVGLYSPLAAALHAVRPVVGLSVNTVPPIAPVDVWLSGDPQPAPPMAWGDHFPAPQAVHHPYRVMRSKKQWQITRAQFGLSETAVVWITAGFRLEHEIGGDWAAQMLDMLKHYPDVVWLLVGGAGSLPPALRSAAAGCVRALPTRDDVVGILRVCDIYVNPPRMGGGFSVAEAMAESLPVVAFAGSDGGDKVGELALRDTDAYIERLAALTESPAMRTELGAALRQRFAERYDIESSGPALIGACEQAATLARARLTKPS